MTEETWSPHPTWSHLNVSTHGRVLNTKTGNFVGTGKAGRYFAAAVAWDREIRRARVEYVHTLVLETFVGPRPEGHDADHVDHDRQNNALTNLRWRLIGDNRSDFVPVRTRHRKT